MSYQIDAQLHEQRARLRIIDAETGRVRLAWDCPLHSERTEASTRQGLHRLFRELMLLSVLDYFAPCAASSNSQGANMRRSHSGTSDSSSGPVSALATAVSSGKASGSLKT